VVGLVALLAGLVLVAELVVRSSLIYVVVAFSPLVFAAAVWPALGGASKRLLQLLGALVVSKLLMAVALAVGAAALAGVGTGGEVTEVPAPEVVAEDQDGSGTQAFGLLLAGAAIFATAAFTPLMLMKLMPLAEGALAAQGIRSGPVRGAQAAMSNAYYARGVGAGGGARRPALAPAGPAGGGRSAAGPRPGPAPSSGGARPAVSARAAGPPESGGTAPGPRASQAPATRPGSGPTGSPPRPGAPSVPARPDRPRRQPPSGERS